MSVPPVMPPAFTRIQSSPLTVTTPHSTSLSTSALRWAGRQSVTVTSPRVTAPAIRSVPATMRSGMISYSTPCSSSTPSMTIVSVPCPEIFAPIAIEKVREIDDLRFHRNVLQRRRPLGKRGGEHRVLRRAHAGHAELDRRTVQANLARVRDEVAVRVVHVASERDEGLLVHVGRARAEHAAAGQRNLGASEASEQRARRRRTTPPACARARRARDRMPRCSRRS